MSKNKFLPRSGLLIILLLQIVFMIYIQKALGSIRFASQNFFFLELVGWRVYLPKELIILLNIGNLVLLWLAARRLFKGNLSLMPPLIYAISPWANYLAVAGSFYIYLLFLILITFNGWLLLGGKQKKLGLILVTLGVVGGFYSSVLLFVLPLALSLVSPKPTARLIVLLTLPLLLLMVFNQSNLKNILASEVRFFSDPGLINNVNIYQGGQEKRVGGS